MDAGVWGIVSDERRRLYVDTETRYLSVHVWQLHSKSNAHISHTNILPGGDRKIICICYKWANEKKVHALQWDAMQNDKAMLKKFIPILESADEVVAQNGDAFDIKVVRGRCLVHRIPMSPKLPSVDTLKQMRSKFNLPSFRLDYIRTILIGEGKAAHGMSLWEDIIERKCPKAMRALVRYCRVDVLALEEIADVIRPYCESKTSIADFPRDCPECGARCAKHQTRNRANGRVALSLLCPECGDTHTITLSQYEKNKRFKKAKLDAA